MGAQPRRAAKASGLAVGAVNVLVLDDDGRGAAAAAARGQGERRPLGQVGGRPRQRGRGLRRHRSCARRARSCSTTRASRAVRLAARRARSSTPCWRSADLAPDGGAARAWACSCNLRDVRHAPGGGLRNVLYHVAIYARPHRPSPSTTSARRQSEIDELRYFAPAEVDHHPAATARLAPNMAFLWLTQAHALLAGSRLRPTRGRRRRRGRIEAWTRRGLDDVARRAGRAPRRRRCADAGLDARGGGRRSCVTGASGLEILFIRRAEHPQDPWSGQMAFPGGRAEPGDADLARHRRPRDPRGDRRRPRRRRRVPGRARRGAGHGAPAPDEPHHHALRVPPARAVRAGAERRGAQPALDARWTSCSAPRAARRWTTSTRASSLQFPCLRVDELVIWGLTYRMFMSFQERFRPACTRGR